MEELIRRKKLEFQNIIEDYKNCKVVPVNESGMVLKTAKCSEPF